MSYSVQENRLTSSGWDELGQTAIDQAMSADFETDAIDVLYFDMGALQVVWSGSDGTTSTIVVQSSLDNLNWCDEAGSSITINTASGTQLYNITSYGQRYVRLKYTAGDATTGVLNFRSVMKTRR